MPDAFWLGFAVGAVTVVAIFWVVALALAFLVDGSLDEAPERITHVAIAFPHDTELRHVPTELPCPPNSHADLRALLPPRFSISAAGAIQGFQTSRRRFVDRHEAARIAVAAGQVDAARIRPMGLDSSDLLQNDRTNEQSERSDR